MKGLSIDNEVMTKVIFKVLSEEWSCESCILEACLEEEDCVNIHVYPQDIIILKKEDLSQGISSGVRTKEYFIAHERM